MCLAGEFESLQESVKIAKMTLMNERQRRDFLDSSRRLKMISSQWNLTQKVSNES